MSMGFRLQRRRTTGPPTLYLISTTYLNGSMNLMALHSTSHRQIYNFTKKPISGSTSTTKHRQLACVHFHWRKFSGEILLIRTASKLSNGSSTLIGLRAKLSSKHL